MGYYLYKLSFTAPVHFGRGEFATALASSGIALCADTLFSALCHSALPMGKLESLVQLAKENKLGLSDLMPYQGDRLYLPKPKCTATVRQKNFDRSQAKKAKKLQYLPVDMLDDFFRSLHQGTTFDVANAQAIFGENYAITKVGQVERDEASPYQVGLFQFAPACGLYGIVSCPDADIPWLDTLLKTLGLEGIGGKTSAGYGSFTTTGLQDLSQDTSGLHQRLLQTQGSQLSLSTALPQEQELPQAMADSSYTLTRRSGFVYSPSVSTPVKKQTQYFFTAGSMFSGRFEGDLYSVAQDLPHPVYRYGRSVFLGVDV